MNEIAHKTYVHAVYINQKSDAYGSKPLGYTQRLIMIETTKITGKNAIKKALGHVRENSDLLE